MSSKRAIKWIMWFISIILLLALTACNSSSKTNSDGGSGTTTLVMWAHQDSGFKTADMELIKAFEKSHPKIKIQYEAFPYDEYINKLKASFSASNGPDIARMFGTWVPQYTKNDLLLEIPNGSELIPKFYKAPVGAYLKNNKLYGIPMEYNIENDGMLVNPKMFQDAGLEYPKTWDELVSDAQKLTVRDGNSLKVRGFDFTSGDSVTFQFLAMILQQNGNYWDSKGHINFHSPEAIKAMTDLVTLASKDKVADYKEMSGTLDASDYFFKGQDAMTLRGPWVIPIGKSTYKAKNFDYIPVPSYTNNPPYFAAESGWGFVGNKQTKNAKAVLEFLNFASNPKNEMKWNEANYTVPAQKAAAEDPAFLKAAPLMKTSLDALKYGQWVGPIGDRDYMWTQINNEFVAMCQGQDTVVDGLKKVETNINAMLDRQ